MLSLPRDLWIEIFSHLIPPRESTRNPILYHTLLSACLACREFNRLAQPALYWTISCVTPLTAEVPSWAMKLVRTLVERPDLGLAVREFQLSERTFLGLNESMRPYLERTIASSRIPTRLRTMLEGAVRSGVPCSMVVSLLLLGLMPRLKYLCHNLGPTNELLSWILGTEIVETREDPWMTRTAIANHLARLEEVSWLCPLQETDSTRAIKELLLHPRMKWFHLTRGLCIEGDDEDIRAQGHESMLYRMKFEQCVLDGPFLKHALRCCKNLGELFLSLLVRLPSQGRYSVSIDLDMYGDALRDFGHNLVKLALSGFNSSTYTIVGKIGSLRQLERLRYLEIEREVLVGHGENQMHIAEVLPVSLECLRCCTQQHDVGSMWQEKAFELEDEMIHLIDDGEFPKLQRIEFDRCEIRWEDPLTRTLEGWSTHDHFSSDTILVISDPQDRNPNAFPERLKPRVKRVPDTGTDAMKFYNYLLGRLLEPNEMDNSERIKRRCQPRIAA
ncbi:hypothetical protein DER45DRAFT_539277 [Fusarium avenaceum]|nr:hypothetical protein DER45DRAFT_539277 [Fusarium avenaceum]